MKITNFRTLDEIIKQQESQNDFKVRCKCGHRVLIVTKDRMICSWCGKYVYKTPKLEFEYKLKEYMLKERRKTNE